MTPEEREQYAEDLAAVAAFLAMAVKQRLELNCRSAREAWDAFMRLSNIPPPVSAELMCKMLGDRTDYR